MSEIEISKIKRGFITHVREIKYGCNWYKKISGSTESRIGDIALATENTKWTKEGRFYLIIECCSPTGFKGIIADDGDPMGIHDYLGGFDFYRKK